MAGPGGGPPRKSHTKSRKGCRTCKRRHIRCDETFPQCKNCSKHNCRCDYMDMPAAGEEPMKGSRPPDLLMSADLQKRLDTWRLTGEPILPELRSPDPAYWTRFSTIDLRLIHHIVTLSSDLNSRGYSTCTAWAAKMPTLVQISLSHDFVMSAMLGLSASHLAWQTKNSDTENLAYHHRGVALKGLHGGLGQFSRETSDAILAGSMLLSWQAPEWKNWASLQQGISTVMSSMRPWAHESELARFLDSQRSLSRARTPSTPTFPNSAAIGMPPEEDVRRVDEMLAALQSLKLRLSTNQEMADHASNILDYLSDLRADLSNIPSPERAFSRLQPLRELIFWLPPGVLRAGESDLAALTLLSHLYATALIVEGLFPEIGASHLGVMCLPPLERIHEILTSRRSSQPADSGCQVALQIVEYPMRVVATYRASQARQRQLSNSTSLSGEHHHPAYAAHRGSTHSPHHSPYMGGGTHHLGMGASGGSPGEQAPSALYGASPVQTPQHMSASAPGAYFAGSIPPAPVAMGNVRRSGGSDSPGMRVPSLGERSASMSLVYGAGAHGQQSAAPSQPPTVRSSQDTDRLEYFGGVGGAASYHHQQQQQQAGHGQQSNAYYAGMGPGGAGGGGHFSHHNRFVAPSQLWT